MEKLDYKKEYKDLYLPNAKPTLIKVPSMKFIMIQGKGNPNSESGEYQEALQMLYTLSFTIKMSKMGSKKIDGYFEYVVPPLEGLWWRAGSDEIDWKDKEKFEWISMIRQPEFVTDEVFQWACKEAKEKKGIDTSKAKLIEFEEELCVQMMHKGPYDNEPITIAEMEKYIKEQNLINAIGEKQENGMIRRHHEIYLSDPRRTKAENLKTVIRIPVRKSNENE